MACHDPIDGVAFAAISIAGDLRIQAAVLDLVKISGWPSRFARADALRKPVGCGAAITKDALLRIFGTSDPVRLEALESAYVDHLRTRLTRRARRPVDDVVLVPGGPFMAGTSSAGNGFGMDDTDNPGRVVELDEFYIDRLAVTNRRYQTFLDDVGDSAEYDHPDQRAGKSHVSAHHHDSRFNQPDMPVVGVDWYDAWAFARWAGGELPSENQWEKSARGVDGREFPWGDVFSADRCNHVERAFGRAVTDLADLEAALLSVRDVGIPAVPLMAADSYPEGVSPYGVVQLSGNTWEMTRTNFFSRADMDPFFKGRAPHEFMNRKDAFHVLRGGAWSSPSCCLTTHFRGRDLLTDRHNEVGFRCVYPTGGDRFD
ncbi:hypothetical protein ALI144C_10270 [Actinosynnema sp. ALI-1.44]|nr:hypothetical protein ALI144C_10270 [Actinosynnema sp. ALI-1.44]